MQGEMSLSRNLTPHCITWHYSEQHMQTYRKKVLEPVCSDLNEKAPKYVSLKLQFFPVMTQTIRKNALQAVWTTGRLQNVTICVCNIHWHPHGGRVETYISLKSMTSFSHHSSAGSACIKPDINNKASFVRPTQYFPVLIKYKFFIFLTCTGKTEAFF